MELKVACNEHLHETRGVGVLFHRRAEGLARFFLYFLYLIYFLYFMSIGNSVGSAAGSLAISSSWG